MQPTAPSVEAPRASASRERFIIMITKPYAGPQLPPAPPAESHEFLAKDALPGNGMQEPGQVIPKALAGAAECELGPRQGGFVELGYLEALVVKRQCATGGG